MKHFRRSIVKTPNVDFDDLEDISNLTEPKCDIDNNLSNVANDQLVIVERDDLSDTKKEAFSYLSPLVSNKDLSLAVRTEFTVSVKRPSFSMAPESSTAQAILNSYQNMGNPIKSDVSLSSSVKQQSDYGKCAINALLSPRIGFRASRSLTSRQSSFASTIEDEAGLVRINQYQILEDLGRGSYGSVKLVEDVDGKKFALKIISKKKLMKSAGLFRRPPPLRNSSSSITSNPEESEPRQPIPLECRNINRNQLLKAASAQSKQSSTSEWSSNSTADNSDRPRTASNFVPPIQRIYQEIAIHKKLNHPNIVKLYEVIDETELPNLYMIFEYIEGGPVMNVGQSEPFSEIDARKYFRDILQGLEYLHFNKIIHRDIKPSNLLVDNNGTVKMIDFGVSCQFTGEDIFLQDTVGSPAFLAPEVVQDCNIKFTGKALDIWALGMTLYCFLYGRVAFDSHSKFDLYHMISTKLVKYPTEPQLSDEALDLLKKMLNKNPKERIKLVEIKSHPWVTQSGLEPFISINNSPEEAIEVTDREVAQCTVETIRFETIVSAIMMARRRSFRNPRLLNTTLDGAGEVRNSTDNDTKPINDISTYEPLTNNCHYSTTSSCCDTQVPEEPSPRSIRFYLDTTSPLDTTSTLSNFPNRDSECNRIFESSYQMSGNRLFTRKDSSDDSSLIVTDT